MTDVELCEACLQFRLTDELLGIDGVTDDGSAISEYSTDKLATSNGATEPILSRGFLWPDLYEFQDSACTLCEFLRQLILQECQDLGPELGSELEPGSMNLFVLLNRGKVPFNDGLHFSYGVFLEFHITHKFSDNILGPVMAMVASSDEPFQKWTNIWRQPSIVTLSTENIEFMQNSLKSCETTCPPAKTSDFVPTRLIYLGEGIEDAPRLIQTSAEMLPDSGITYAALSYCWGDTDDAATQLKTLRSNITNHMRAIPCESASKVMLDAFQVCRLLSIKYIWIDALCIIQDAPVINAQHDRDWDKESENMGLIFKNAHVTLCASSSNSCRQSFLERDQLSVTLPFRSEFSPLVHGTYSLVCLPREVEHRSHPLTIAKSHWLNRGWVFQEREMSTRLLIFDNLMMQFRCSYCARSEIGVQHQSDKAPLIYSSRMESLAKDAEAKWYEIYDLYSNLTQEFSALSLTYPSDRLPAISGFAKRFGEITHDQYLAGLWRRLLHLELLWEMRIESGSTLATLVSRRYPSASPIAPSWTWASEPGGYHKAQLHQYFCLWDEQDVTPSYQQLRGCTETVGSNPYGQVKDGTIAVTARAKYFPWDGSYQLKEITDYREEITPWWVGKRRSSVETWTFEAIAPGSRIKVMEAADSTYFAYCSLDWKLDESMGATELSSLTDGLTFVLIASSFANYEPEAATFFEGEEMRSGIPFNYTREHFEGRPKDVSDQDSEQSHGDDIEGDIDEVYGENVQDYLGDCLDEDLEGRIPNQFKENIEERCDEEDETDSEADSDKAESGSRNRNAWGLILASVPSIPGSYIRVGIFSSRVSHGGGWYLFSRKPYQTYHIV